MRWLATGLTLINVATLSAFFLGIVCGGLGRWVALLATLFGLVAAAFAFVSANETADNLFVDYTPTPAANKYGKVWFWLLAGCFGFFAFRAFCWLLFLDGAHFKIQSPNNLGDLALHLTYIKNLASGVPLWPENPIHFASHMRYPAGTDLFNSLLLLLGVDLIHGLIWVGLIGSLATFYALYRWGGLFGVAGFLFNGGLAGFQILQTWQFLDYQGDKSIAWKSLPLAMFVTQRGLLYALPAGLLLLCQWRAKFEANAPSLVVDQPSRGSKTWILPFWIEAALYASMPLFHLHTFMALSIVAAFLFAIGSGAMRRHLGLLAGISFVPATYLVWTVTDHFQARSLMEWQSGWVRGVDDYSKSFLWFWFENFGLLIPLLLLLAGVYIWRARPSLSGKPFRFRDHPTLAFLAPATLIFFFACFVKTAPWGWDNIKLIIWAYLITLPFLWRELIAPCPFAARAMICVALFASGFVSLFGGLLNEPGGYTFADRAEFDAVGVAVRRVPVQARFAAYPTYNHPLLLQGRRVVLGYPGHLWTQGFDYANAEHKLTDLMRGAPEWRKNARSLHARYLFWGREEKANYSTSTRVWEREAKLIANGSWGAIYDLESPADAVVPRQ